MTKLNCNLSVVRLSFLFKCCINRPNNYEDTFHNHSLKYHNPDFILCFLLNPFMFYLINQSKNDVSENYLFCFRNHIDAKRYILQ